MAWYSPLFKNFPQFVVIHTFKGFSGVNEAEIDVFLEFSCFFYDAMEGKCREKKEEMDRTKLIGEIYGKG